MSARRTAIAVVLLLFVLPGAAAAAEADALPSWLQINSTVRFKVLRADTVLTRGRLLGLDRQALHVQTAGVPDTLSVPLEMLRDLQVYGGPQRRTSRGAGIGFIAGALTGAVLASLAVVSSQGEFIEIGAEIIPVGMVVFGSGGALLGAAIGSGYTGERWVSMPPPWVAAP